jgi:hypothetical protein
MGDLDGAVLQYRHYLQEFNQKTVVFGAKFSRLLAKMNRIAEAESWLDNCIECFEQHGHP